MGFVTKRQTIRGVIYTLVDAAEQRQQEFEGEESKSDSETCSSTPVDVVVPSSAKHEK